MRKTDKARSIGETVQRDAEKKDTDVRRMKKELMDVQQAFQRAQGKTHSRFSIVSFILKSLLRGETRSCRTGVFPQRRVFGRVPSTVSQLPLRSKLIVG
jgi:hypothetical protein